MPASGRRSPMPGRTAWSGGLRCRRSGVRSGTRRADRRAAPNGTLSAAALLSARCPRRRRLMQRCDLVTVSTEALAREAEKLGLPAAVVTELPERRTAASRSRIAAPYRRRDGARRLSKRLAHPSARLPRVRSGAANGDAAPSAFAVPHCRLSRSRSRLGRIRRADRARPVSAARRDAALVGECDINLAPLELGNPFCEGKSELKFFEAALVKRADDRFADRYPRGGNRGRRHRPARTATRTGWGRAFDALVTSAARRHAIGEAARQAALSRYTLGTVAPLAAAALGLPAPDAPHG